MSPQPAVAEKYAPGLLQALLAWTPFAVGIAATVFVSIGEPNVPLARTQFSIWLSIVLAAPALLLFTRDFQRVPMIAIWRLYWTLALLAYLFHLWYGIVVMFRGELLAVTASQGWLTALFNTIVTVLWIIDVALAWSRSQSRIVPIVRAAAFGAFFFAAILSTELFARDALSVGLGLLTVAAVLIGSYLRLQAETVTEI
jgi:hypothetical protein